MTVTSTTNTSTHTGDGSQTTFSFGFLVFLESHMKVYFDGVEQVSGWSIPFADLSDPTGGDVVFSSPPADGVLIELTREVPLIQDVDYDEYDSFPAAVNERSLDILTMITQQLSNSGTGRVLRKPNSDDDGAMIIPPASVRRGTFAFFEDTDDADMVGASGVSGTAISSPMEPVVQSASISAARTNLGSGAFGDGFFTAATLAAALGLLKLPVSNDRYISGLVVTNNDTDAEHDIDISTGVCRDDADTQYAVLSSTLTKKLDATFAEGDNAGGFASGVSLPVSATVHVFLVEKDVAPGTFDVMADISVSGANINSGWTKIRRIISLTTDSSSNLHAMQISEIAGGGLHCLRGYPTADVNTDTNPGTAKVNVTLPVPTFIEVRAQLAFSIRNNDNNFALIAYPTDGYDFIPGTATVPGTAGFDVFASSGSNAYQATVQKEVRTNTSRQISYRVTASGAGDEVKIYTLGWFDDRR